MPQQKGESEPKEQSKDGITDAEEKGDDRQIEEKSISDLQQNSIWPLNVGICDGLYI